MDGECNTLIVQLNIEEQTCKEAELDRLKDKEVKTMYRTWGVEDLQKARFYLDKLIDVTESESVIGRDNGMGRGW